MDYSDMMYSSAMATGLLKGMILSLIFSLVVLIFTLVCMVKIFRKGGYSGWEAIVPIYNTICWLRLGGLNPLLVLLCFVPLVNIVFIIWSNVKVLKCFGCDAGIIILYFLVPFVGLPLVAFSNKYTYLGVV